MTAELFHNCVLEFLGTLMLILVGEGVNCACSLNKTKAQNAGWLANTFGWGLAVMCGVFVAHESGAHLNPSVTIAFACAGQFAWCDVAPYVVAQMLGGFCGAVLVFLVYFDHFKATEDKATKLGIFCTAPTFRNTWNNILSEVMATFVLILGILCIGTYGATTAVVNIGADAALPVTFLIMAIGMSLGATTGYAMNAARDLAPRIAHAILPIPDKGDSDWGYAWIPVVGPIIGAVLAAGVYVLVYC